MEKVQCVFEGCDRPRMKNFDLCSAHRRQITEDRNQGPLRPKYGKDDVCKFEGCGGIPKARGYCGGHAQQIRRGYELTPLREYVAPGSPCKFPGCEKIVYSKGYCMGHDKQLKKGKELTPLKKRDKGTWGEEWKNSGGYMMKTRYNWQTGKKEDRAVHRLVMEEFLGRELLPHETVHHVNGVRDMNVLSNLELWSHSQPYGQRVPDKVKWATEILNTYASERLITDYRVEEN